MRPNQLDLEFRQLSFDYSLSNKVKIFPSANLIDQAIP